MEKLTYSISDSSEAPSVSINNDSHSLIQVSSRSQSIDTAKYEMINENSEDFKLISYKTLLSTENLIGNYLQKRTSNDNNFGFCCEESPKYVQFVVKKNFLTSQEFYCNKVEKLGQNRYSNFDSHENLRNLDQPQNFVGQELQRKSSCDSPRDL